MIVNITWDSIPFLLLASNVLFGFGVAMPVMLRSSDSDNTCDAETDNVHCTVKSGDANCTIQNDDVHCTIQNDFGSFHKSLLTLFYALLGDFDKEARSFLCFD